MAAADAEGTAHRFLWIDEDLPILGGQWMAIGVDGLPQPEALADVVSAFRSGTCPEDPLPVHVDATLRVITAAGALEDGLFPEPADRLRTTLTAVQEDAPEVDPSSLEGAHVRRGAEALEKLAADLAELVEEQLDGGSLANLPPDSTRALCQATQTAWRLRRLVDPPSPLYL